LVGIAPRPRLRPAGDDLLEPGGRVDPARLAGAAAAVRAHLRATAAIEADAAVCPLEAVDLVAVEYGILAVLKAPCGTVEAGLSYSSRLLHGTNPATIQHVVLLKGDDAIPAALTREWNRLEIQAPRPLIEVVARYLASGAEHILVGYDHVAFLLALLIALGFFNIGVEIGQVALVVLVVPLLLGIDRLGARVPAMPARRPDLVYSLSAVIAGLGG
jgi:hypothetical protein